jgi:hypothetical protein
MVLVERWEQEVQAVWEWLFQVAAMVTKPLSPILAALCLLLGVEVEAEERMVMIPVVEVVAAPEVVALVLLESMDRLEVLVGQEVRVVLPVGLGAMAVVPRLHRFREARFLEGHQ